MRTPTLRLRLAVTAAVGTAAVVPPLAVQDASAAPPAGGACSPSARIEGFSDALDKATFAGTRVGGLSALVASPDGDRGLALVDNEGSTPARAYALRGLRSTPRPVGIVRFTRADGTPYTGTDFDGEGLAALPGGGLLAASETEPSIRSFGADGRQTGELPVPGRFRVAPAGEATANQTFEGLGLAQDGRSLWAGMEGPLSADGRTAEGGARLRLQGYRRSSGGFAPGRQVGYVADPGLGLAELQVVDREQLLVLERGFVPGAGNTIRIYRAFLAGAQDVSAEPTLARPGLRTAAKRLLVDLGDCPSLGATSPGTQANPLLDNVEAMALGPGGGQAWRDLTLLSDDNFSSGQVTRLYRLQVQPGR